MKIAFLTYSLAGGGAERMVSRLANEMNRRGHDVTIILFYDFEQAYQINEGIHVIIYKKPKKIQNRSVHAIWHRVKSLHNILTDIQAEVVFAFMTSMVPYAVLAAKGTKTKVIGAERTNPRILGKEWRIFIKLFSPFCDGYIFQTNGVKQYYPEKIVKRSIVIGNIAPESRKKKGNFVELEKSFCSVGRLNNSKDFVTLFKAIALVKKKIPNIQITIWGQGNKENEYKQLVKEYGLNENIVFAGFSKNILEELGNYQYFIFPGKAEGMPNALLEAMSVGLECISTDCDFGPSELIQDGINGWLVPVGDAISLAERMIFCLKNFNKHEQICAKAKQVQEKYSLDSIVNAYIDYAMKVCNE